MEHLREPGVGLGGRERGECPRAEGELLARGKDGRCDGAVELEPSALFF